MRDRSRTARSETKRAHRHRVRVAAAVVVVAAACAGLAFAVAGGSNHSVGQAAALLASLGAERTESTGTAGASADGTTTAVPIEVPQLVNMQIDEAELLLKAVGLTVVRTSTPAGDETSGTVLAQTPKAGTLITPDTVVELVIADPMAVREASTVGRTGIVVCLDPGHQLTADLAQEPIGPGASATKPKVTAGSMGVATGQQECSLALSLSLKVKQRLEDAGVMVVMTRTIDNVDISNAQRAQVANEAGADLFVRIHADFSTNAELSGVTTLYPSGNTWVAAIEKSSLAAAQLIEREVVAATGAKNLEVRGVADLAGFNYAKMPCVLVQVGYLSNPADDRLLASADYEDRMAEGIARGILIQVGIKK